MTGDVDIGGVTTQDLRSYLAWLRTDYKPRRLNGDGQPPSSKTIRNVHITFSSFFSWLEDEFRLPDPMKGVPAPREPGGQWAVVTWRSSPCDGV